MNSNRRMRRTEFLSSLVNTSQLLMHQIQNFCDDCISRPSFRQSYLNNEIRCKQILQMLIRGRFVSCAELQEDLRVQMVREAERQWQVSSRFVKQRIAQRKTISFYSGFAFVKESILVMELHE